jgi:hypothetical protein
MPKYLSITLTLVMFPLLLSAQQPQQRVRGDFEKVEAEKIAFYTRTMELTSREAKEFWPVYDGFQEQRSKLVRERISISANFTRSRGQLTEREAADMADRYIELQVREADLAREYHEKFKAILPPDKVMRLYQAEHEFKMQLLRRVRGGGPGAGAGRETRGPGRP